MASGSDDIIKRRVKALTFDVFGTVVDWRSSVVDELSGRAAAKLSTVPEAAGDVLKQLTKEDWGRFAQDWRDTYKVFCGGFVPGVSTFKSIDQHHHDALIELLDKWQLNGVYTADEIKDLSLVWHRLNPWDDSSEGIHLLGKQFVTSTLSNGNHELLRDLDTHGNLGFRKFISSADFKAYKPNPAVYLGAIKELGLQPGEVAMVAAHLGDLKAARACGMRTVYVERKQEEDWKAGDERLAGAKDWVNIWISEGDGGFVELARRLGLS